MIEFNGIYPPVITPFTRAYRINQVAFIEQIEYLIAAGVDGLIVGGSTGEYYALSIAERIQLAEIANDCIASRLPLIIGTGATQLADSITMAKTAKRIAADAILVSTPPYALPTEKENAVNALRIEQAAELPIMLYNFPGRMGVNMGAEFLTEVTKSANFCAIKESSGDINRLHLLTQSFPQIQLSCGMDDQALEFFAWGARSWVCGAANFLPREHRALYSACVVERNFSKGRRIMSALMPLMKLLEQGGKFIQTIKYGVTCNGRNAGSTRPPLIPLRKNEQRKVDRVLTSLASEFATIEKE